MSTDILSIVSMPVAEGSFCLVDSICILNGSCGTALILSVPAIYPSEVMGGTELPGP